jgi:uncharacterized protein YukJ
VSKKKPYEMLVYIKKNFVHKVTGRLESLPLGYSKLPQGPDGSAIDYVRGGFIENINNFTSFSANLLSDSLNELVSPALGRSEFDIYIFGSRWGPEKHKDKYFGFSPGQGIHNVHYNQGSPDEFARYNGSWQDGAIFLHDIGKKEWTGIFLMFQDQEFPTDN